MVGRPRPDVLLVDDDPDVRRSLTRALQTAGYTVQRAEHGAEALEKIADQEFAVVVCDLMMPVMDGMRLYARLRTVHPDTADRVLFITGWAHDTRIRQFLKWTDRPTLLKPFEITDFLDEVGRVTGDEGDVGRRATPASYSPEESARIHKMMITPGVELVCPLCGASLAMSPPPSADAAVTELRCIACQRVMIVRGFQQEP